MEIIKNNIKYYHFFNSANKRHYINGFQAVLHCHHYTTLYTQLAIDAGETELLKECARESFREILDNYFAENSSISSIQDKVDIATQYYSLLGMGKMIVHYLTEYSGKVELLNSHLDSGWIKKWGTYDKPVNFITAGYIEAMFESILNLPDKTFLAFETQSIVKGSQTSIFNVTRR